MKKEAKMNDAQLEAVSGGIQSAVICGDAGLVLDGSVNNSGNTNTLTQVDASTHIQDSFNMSQFHGPVWPM